MTLSPASLRPSAITAALPGVSFAPRSLRKLSSTPMSDIAPPAPPAAAPIAMPTIGARKMRPIRPPHSAPPAAPAPAVGGEEEGADRPPPPPAPGGPGARRAHGLVQLDLAVGPVGHDDAVLELEHLLLRRLDELAANGLSRLLVGVCDGDQRAHGVLSERLYRSTRVSGPQGRGGKVVYG